MRGKRLLVCAVVALVTILSAGYAGAAGFQLFEQNASGIGNAYAGSAAVADNASTIFFNPAGMTKLQAREISLGASAVKPSMKFTDNGSTTPQAFTAGFPPGSTTTPAAGNDGGDAGGWNYIPNGFLSWALTKDLYAGIGVSVPFGLATEYEGNWYGRYQSIKFAIETLNVNPSIAYRVNDMISLGVGVNWQQMKAEYIRQGHPTLGQVKLKADDNAWGWNLGALFQLAPATRLGLSYRSAIKHALGGDLSGNSLLGLPQPASADIELPDTAIVSFTQGLGNNWELLGDVSWTGWSSIDKVNVMNTATGALAQTLDANFKDTWRVALGANYKVSEAWKLKFGLAYDQTPVPDAQRRMVSLPDSDRTAVATGVQWKPGKASALDFGVEYLFMKGADIENSQNPTRGIVKGDYSNNALILGAQYSLSF
jgi:long-chain fatty acid transport protein